MNETPCPHDQSSPEVREAIETYAHRLLEHIQYPAQNRPAVDLDAFREELSTLLCLDGTEVLGLDLDQQLGLVEDYADELDLQLDSADIDRLRFQVASLAAQVVARLGEERARELLLDLERFMNRRDLDLESLTMVNHLSIVAHQSERTESDGTTVYEYRGLDGVDIDVYETRLAGGPVYFQKVATRS